MASDSSVLTAEGTAAYRREVEEAASALRRALPSPPQVGILNDIDLEGLLAKGTEKGTVPFADLPHFPASGGAFTFGVLDGTRVISLDQHLHLYEGDTPRAVTFPVRMLVEAGIDTLLVAAPASSVNPQFGRGEVMLLTDHINFQGQNPLVGPNVEAWGPRFPDMTEPYDARLQQLAGTVAQTEGLSLQKGVYLALLGPNPETTAEHRMARRLGADAIGMSVVPEVIAARHMGIQVVGMTLLTEQHLTDEAPSPPVGGDGQALERGRLHLRRLATSLLGHVGADAPMT